MRVPLAPVRALVAALMWVGLLAAGCSPEATRTRSGGPGADLGNRSSSVELHGQPNPFYRTPLVGKGISK